MQEMKSKKRDKIKIKLEQLNKRLVIVEICFLWCKWNGHEITSDDFVAEIEKMMDKDVLLATWNNYIKLKSYKRTVIKTAIDFK